MALQVDRLEGDAPEALHAVPSIKNTFPPIHRIPPELLSLIPQYWDEVYSYKNLVALTHVCQRWREIFIAHSSLWTHLECKHVEKTRAYIERSKSSPLEIALCEFGRLGDDLKNAFLLVIPHISRVMSIKIVGSEDLFRTFTMHFSCPVPLLRHLDLYITWQPPPVLDNTLFDCDLRSLRTLTMAGVVPHLPWKSLPQLTAFTLSRLVSTVELSVTRLLDLFSNAPLLSKIELHVISKSSDAPPGQVVSLLRLERFSMMTDERSTSTLLNHLLVPAGALLHLGLHFHGIESPLPKFLPKNPETLRNIHHITSAYLYFELTVFIIKLDRPSGGLNMRGCRADWTGPNTVVSERMILSSLDYFDTSKFQRLAITKYGVPTYDEFDESHHYLLGIMNGLRTLFLNQCNALPFISALDPDRNPQKSVPCPKLEELVLFIRDEGRFYVKELMDMVKGRASKGSELRSITVIGLKGVLVEEDVFKLRECVEHVECRFEKYHPRWDKIPDYERN